MAVLGPPRVDDFDAAVVAAERKRCAKYAVADLDLLEQRRIVLGVGRGLVEVVVHLREKADRLRHRVTSGESSRTGGRRETHPTIDGVDGKDESSDVLTTETQRHREENSEIRISQSETKSKS
jgi:hypothetical protein